MPSVFTSNLPNDIIIGSALLYDNTTPWGASSGNLTFEPGTEWYNVEFDGKASPVAEIDMVAYRAPMFTGSLIEFPTARIVSLEPGSTSATAGGVTTHTPNPANELLAAADYLTNTRLVWKRGSGGYVWVRFPVALVTKYSVQGQDRKNATIPIEIQARLAKATAATSTDTAPYVIEYSSSLPA